MDLTGTFKQRKGELVSQGFATDDPVYFRRDAEKTYVPFSLQLTRSLENGELRL